MFDPIDPHDPLSLIPTDACPECSAVMQDYGCRNCGYERPPAPRVTRPAEGEDLPSIGGW